MSEVSETVSCNVLSIEGTDLFKRIRHLMTSTVNVQFAPSFKDKPPPLVTVEEMQKAKDLCPHRMNGCFLLEITPSTILKVGSMATMGEAEAMILVRKKTSVPVPQVFNAYTIEEVGFILEEKMPGVQISAAWKTLSRSSKESIVDQLREYAQQWRQIRGSFLGTVDGGPCQDIIFKHPWEQIEYEYGPFQSRKEFNRGMVEALRNSRPGKRLTDKDQLFAEELLVSGSDEEDIKVLTHGDLHASNIILQDGVITGIIDWGAAGYSMPSREYFCLRWTATNEEWIELTKSVLPNDGCEFWSRVNYQMMAYTCI